MNLQTCEQLYRDLALKHRCDYEFKWMKRQAKFARSGECNWSKRIIRLQPTYVELNTVEEITNTILHEIAHALTPKHGHNYFWKRKAIEIGCTGKRTYGKNVIREKAQLSNEDIEEVTKDKRQEEADSCKRDDYIEYLLANAEE